MTPLDALAERLRELHPDGQCVGQEACCLYGPRAHYDALAREALRWVEEQLPGREEIAFSLWRREHLFDWVSDDRARRMWESAKATEEPPVKLAYRNADALLALLREKLKGENT